MKIVFCVHSFSPENIRLQPWLTVYKVSELLMRRGHSVEVVTDTETTGDISGVRVHRVASFRGTNSGQVRAMLEKLEPERVVTTVTPLNLATTGWYGSIASARWIAFASYPFYETAELFRAFLHVDRKDILPYFRHALVPRRLWVSRLRERFHAVICQSERTTMRLSRLAGPDVPAHTIAPGIDKDLWRRDASGHRAAVPASTFLYLGAASRIRGFYVALKAMKRLGESDIRLQVLARGADDRRVDEIEDAISRAGLKGRVTVVGGWLSQARLSQYIREASAVLLPFILVPSELPVSVMEVIACGTPVIATDLDGLPSFVGPAGKIVTVGSASALADAMYEVHENTDLQSRWIAGAERQAATWETWDTIGERWMRVLGNA